MGLSAVLARYARCRHADEQVLAPRFPLNSLPHIVHADIRGPRDLFSL